MVKTRVNRLWRWAYGTPEPPFVVRLLGLFWLLYGFLVGVALLSSGLRLLTGGWAEGLFSLTSSPLTSLMVGLLATVLFQSSSVTTSIIVGMVAAGSLPIAGVVPMIMGANLGTSVTNTFISMGYINNRTLDFKRAFAAATVHDFFNILTVAFVLPIEMFTGFMEQLATYVAELFHFKSVGPHFSSPIKWAISPPVRGLEFFFKTHWDSWISGFLITLLSAFIIFLTLSWIVRLMRYVVVRPGGFLTRKLSENSYNSFFLGVGATVLAQSSSVTTSLMVPMAASGFLTLRSVFSVTVGANIGTTVTALLAAMATNKAGLIVALAHLLFNLIGTCLFFLIPSMRKWPIVCAENLASLTDEKKWVAPVYVGVLFFVFPFSVIYLFEVVF